MEKLANVISTQQLCKVAHVDCLGRGSKPAKMAYITCKRSQYPTFDRLLGYVQYYTRTCTVEGGTITANPLHLQFTDKLQIGDYAFIVCVTALYFSLGLSARYMAKVGVT